MQPGRIFNLLTLSIVTAALSCGCSSFGRARAAASPKFYAVTADSTPFYRYGPQQGSGPDRTLPKDSLITLIRPSFGYSKVKLITGEQGYVASDDIRLASATLIAAVNTPPVETTATQLDLPETPQLPFEPSPEFEPTPIPMPPNFAN